MQVGPSHPRWHSYVLIVISSGVMLNLFMTAMLLYRSLGR
jgi:hypothetical protein